MRPFSTIAAAIFLLMALVHLYRIAVGFPITISGTNIGQEVSWAALIATSIMAAGLFRESRGLMPTHHITLTAELNPSNPMEIRVTGNGRRRLPRGSGWHHFKFTLNDRTPHNVEFLSLAAADNCSDCPPPAGSSSGQIVNISMDNNPGHGRPRTAEFEDRNDNKPAMNVSYQWAFRCNPGMTVLPFDPIISNGGRV